MKLNSTILVKVAVVVFALFFSISAFAGIDYKIKFSGNQSNPPFLFHGGSNSLNINQGDSVSGFIDFSVFKNMDNYLSDPHIAFYTNLATTLNFNGESSDPRNFAYSYVLLNVEYGNYQFYVNSQHDGLSDVYEINLNGRPNFFSTDNIELSDINSESASFGNEWFFQRYDFQTGALTQYHGNIKSFEIVNLTSPIPEPKEINLLLLGLLFIAVFCVRKRGAREIVA